MKITHVVVLVGLMFSTSVFAASYQLNVEKIKCNKCVQKIHDYFVKNYGQRIQNLKIDEKNSKVTFDSISIDSVEKDIITRDLDTMSFKVTFVDMPTVVEQAPATKPTN